MCHGRALQRPGQIDSEGGRSVVEGHTHLRRKAALGSRADPFLSNGRGRAVEARVQSRCGMRRRCGVVDCGGDGGGSER